MKNIIHKVLVTIHEFDNRLWFIASILSTTIGAWFPLVIGFFGVKLHLVKITEDGAGKELTALGLILTIVTNLWTFLNNIARRYDEQVVKKEIFNEDKQINKLISPLKDCANELCTTKLSLLLEDLDSIRLSNDFSHKIIEKPCRQLEEMGYQIANVMSDIFTSKKSNFRNSDFYVSIYYNFPKISNKWFPSNRRSVSQGLKPSELTREGTTFSELLKDPKKHILFFNSKQEAYSDQKYIPDNSDKYDSSGKLLGSIICYKRTFATSQTANLINCMICVSTNNKSIFSSDDGNKIKYATDYLENIAFEEISTRIGIELCYYYMQKLHKNCKPEPAKELYDC